jgi:hypothetical protein
MHRFFVLLFVFFSCFRAFSQQGHFVFINHEEKLPFYVRMGEKIYSSSVTGHLTMAPLADSVYIMYIGFPRSRAAEQAFDVKVNQADRGLLLDKTPNGWRMTDLITGEVIDPVSNPAAMESGSLVKKTDSFSLLMAGVVDDSSVLYSAAKTNVPEKKTDGIRRTDTLKMLEAKAAGKENGVVPRAPVNSAVGQKRKDNAGSVKKETYSSAFTIHDSIFVANAGKRRPDSSIVSAVMAKSSDTALKRKDILRLGTENLAEGRLIIYVDRTGPVADTIRLIIPGL